jgi:hypothetical protein
MNLIEELRENYKVYWQSKADKDRIKAEKYFEKNEQRWLATVRKLSKQGRNYFYPNDFFYFTEFNVSEFQAYLLSYFAVKHGFKQDSCSWGFYFTRSGVLP